MYHLALSLGRRRKISLQFIGSAFISSIGGFTLFAARARYYYVVQAIDDLTIVFILTANSPIFNNQTDNWTSRIDLTCRDDAENDKH